MMAQSFNFYVTQSNGKRLIRDDVIVTLNVELPRGEKPFKLRSFDSAVWGMIRWEDRVNGAHQFHHR